MEDVKKYIKSLKKAGLYKARLEDGDKEIIFSDNTFEVRTLPGRIETFPGLPEPEAFAVTEVGKKKKEPFPKTEARRTSPSPKKEIIKEVEPDSYRVSASKKLFWVAAVFIIVIAAAAGIYFLNQSGKIKLDTFPENNETQVTKNETGEDKPIASGDVKPEEDIKSDDVIEDPQGEDRTADIGETGETAGDPEAGTPPEDGPDDKPAAGEGEGGEAAGELTVETTDPGGVLVKDSQKPASDTQKLPVATTKPVIEPKKDTGKPKKQDIKPQTPAVQTVKIIKLPASLIKGYNNTLSRIVIPLVPVRIKVSGYLNVKISIDEKGKASARILSSANFNVTPKSDREKMINRIIKRISGLQFAPPKDKQGKPVRVSEFNIDYQAGKLKTRLILKKR